MGWEKRQNNSIHDFVLNFNKQERIMMKKESQRQRRENMPNGIES
jgi:hypothetical protein